MSTQVLTSLTDPILAEHPTYVGGATDIMPLLKNKVRDDRELVLTKKVPALHELTRAGDTLTVGAAVTLTELAESALVRAHCPAVAQAASLTASPQIRNIATLGGNVMQDRRCIYFNQPPLWRSGLLLCFKTGGAVCHQIPNSPVCRAIYYSDVATALIAHGAQVEYIEHGETRRTGVADLVARHTQANGRSCHEHLPILVTRFFIPAAAWSGFYKYAMRTTIDFPLINFALAYGETGSTLVAGAVAPQPVILSDTAALITAGAGEEEIVSACEKELTQKAAPIREACITPALKRSLYRHVALLLRERPETR